MGFAYLRSVNGYVKIAEQVLNLVALICVGAAHLSPRGEAFLAASVGAFLITFIITAIRVFDVDQKVLAPWNKIEFLYCVIWALFYLITAALVIDTRYDPFIAGGVFGLFATIVYIYDAYLNFTTE